MSNKGTHLDGINETKKYTSLSEVLRLPDFFCKLIYIPIVNPVDASKVDLLIKIGDEVKSGTLLFTRTFLNETIYHYASVSGKVIGIENMYHIGLNKNVDHLVIENDFKYEAIKVIDPISLNDDKNTIIDALQKVSSIGLGGAGFPTFLKYKNASNIHTLIINGVECEPFLTTDYKAMKQDVEMFILGIELLLKAASAKKAYICFKKTKESLVDVIKPHLKGKDYIEIFLVDDVYPMGWEKMLVRTILNVDYDRLPSEVGVIVNNAQTTIEFAKSSVTGCYSNFRMITVSGDGINKESNVIVPIGVKVADVIKFMDGYKYDDIVLMPGGPMTSKKLLTDECAVLGNTSGLTILKRVIRNTKPCIHCYTCVRNCPSKIFPVNIKDAYQDNNVEKIIKLTPNKCIECGLCSYVCPSEIEVMDFVKKAKEIYIREIKK